MRQCTAICDVPPASLVTAILAGQGRVSGHDLAGAPDRVRCELALWHEGEHADHVWDWRERPSHALWARWTTQETMRFETLHWCETPGGPAGDACTLYRGHARDHSWNVHDPETEALRRSVQADPAGWTARLTGRPRRPPRT